jgi:hypothetical protein
LGTQLEEILRLAGEIDSKNKTKSFKKMTCLLKGGSELVVQAYRNYVSRQANMAVEDVIHGVFMKLSEVITEPKLSGTDIYNVGEPGIILDNRGCKIIASKASKSV